MPKTYKNFDDLMKEVETYIKKPESLEKISAAYEKARSLHEGQLRKSGEPYIIHPLNVAGILAELHAGPDTICAGLLHDVVEDTECTNEDIAKEFGTDIAEMVDGVTKVGQLKFASLEQKQATNHQHILLAMAKDIRVVIVKLADRLHNIRTLGVMSDEQKVRIARETLEIYAPLAHKLGIYTIKAELEDTALKYIEPGYYNKIVQKIKNDSSARMNNVDHTINEISKILLQNNIADYKIKGRIKNIYSIYKKMVNQNKEFEDIYDILAIRIIVDTVSECYQCLGLIHANYNPVPKRFKDYIAVPKPNMYQSLHTTVISKDGFTFEVQIRTVEMDKIAELGVAAHWAYKEGVAYNKEREQYEIASKLKWYGDLLKFNEDEEKSKNDAKEYVDQVKEDLLGTTVYVYTPTGEIIDLPKGATPLDFAYRIHTNVGNTTVGALVNNRIVPLDYELQNGDIVSIKTNKNSFGPSENWLKIAKTNNAKHKIKNFLNKQNRDILVAHGKQELEEEFRNNKITNFELTNDFVKNYFSKYNINTVDDLYAEVAKSNISPKTIIQKYTGTEDDKKVTEEIIARAAERNNTKFLTTNSETGVIVEGLTNPQLKLGSCCNPIPGDPIVGYVTKGYGIVVHHQDCKNCESFQKERLIPLRWADNPNRKYPALIKIEATSSMNLLVEIMNTVSSSGMSILAIHANSNSNLETVVKLKVSTTNLLELEKMIVNLKKVKYIYNIVRENL
ncbi:MAG: bifunctional (p)ppGpp synthetase/guanosine-3',5'-bis(diphosphate) 3'-pyrophosphohydrolase [Acholeplasmatales bacterium]|nr:bifunctional (p)ppGpp synthetase/guanosine-3',5'-bis(diphosphate) 3'-pyrophosphohydrolase [Acholeplasmatales bacterium]